MDNLFSLYIHIPFCENRCSYCDFFSSTDDSFVGSVVDRLCEDIRFFGAEFDWGVDTLYVGGGTPSFISESYMEKLFTNLDLSNVREATIEVNPKSISKEKLDFYWDLGINRLSMGVQSFDNNLLKQIGRDSTKDINISACQTVASHWKGKINYDLINCIEGQKKDQVIQDINLLHQYRAGHISVYNLTLNHQSKNMPEIEKATEQTLKSLGYKKYEISNYAKLNEKSQHNLAYWNLDNFYGIGPSASGTFTKNKKHYRRETISDIKKYISRPPEKSYTEEKIQPIDFAIDYLIMNSRLIEGIDLAKYQKKCGFDLTKLIPQTISKWQNYSLIKITPTHLKFSSKGINQLNQFLVEALSEIEK